MVQSFLTMRFPTLGTRAIYALAVLFSAHYARATEGDALTIDANIRARHVPYGSILDPMFAEIGSEQIATYTRCGDSALWTGNYLAAEAFRYGATHSSDARKNLISAFAALKGLVAVTGNNLLARCMVPLDSPYADSISVQEAANGIHSNSSAGWIWVGNTSRDEYTGALFGLTVAYDMIDDANTKSDISALTTLIIDYVRSHNWSVVMPDGSSSTSFLPRPDQIETLLAIGRHVNPDHFSGFAYEAERQLFASSVPVPIAVDTTSDDSYFKFNLDYLNLYNLVRIEASAEKSIYQAAYDTLRSHTVAHQNAFFNAIDLALNGPDHLRDTETLLLLNSWLLRPKRDFTVDLTHTVSVCGSQACNPVPVQLRPNTDFLWQRSPFQLSQGGFARIETAGIDYILPYWMARYYGLRETAVIQSSAAPSGAIAPGSLATIYGANLAATTETATSLPLPNFLGGTRVTVQDSAGTQSTPSLLYASPSQINLLIPDGIAEGIAIFSIDNGSGTPLRVIGAVGRTAPAIFTANGTGSGLPAANAFRGSNLLDLALPIDLSTDTTVYVTLYGTGIRNRTSRDDVSVFVNGTAVPVLYAGPQPTFAGLDQINIQLPSTLRGSGLSSLQVIVDNHESNISSLNIQ